jgi:hypothetical protein
MLTKPGQIVPSNLENHNVSRVVIDRFQHSFINDCVGVSGILLVQRKLENGQVRAAMQCQYCGHTQIVKSAFVVGKISDLPLHRLDAYREKAERTAPLLAKYRQEQEVERKEKRLRYMMSDEWRSKRLACLRRSPVCEASLPGCTRRAIMAHHLTYDRLFREEPEDLMAVCESCHASIHNVEVS